MKATSFLPLIFLFSCTHPDTPKVPLKSMDRQYQQCFQESDVYRDKNVKPSGDVTIKFVLMPDGKIEDETIASTDFKDANFHACLLDITRQLKLPPKKAPTKVTKQINFSSKVKIYE